MIQILNLKESPHHLEQLAQWHQSQWQHYNHGETLLERIKRMQDYLNDDFIPSTFIAINETTLLGSVAIVQHDMEIHQEFSPWIASVFTNKDYRNQGIATKLIKHMLHQAKLSNIKKCYLFTPDQESFYKKIGWETICHVKYHKELVSIMSIDTTFF